MSIKIEYENFKFNAPRKISENEFIFIKQNLHLNPFYEIEPKNESVIEKFGLKLLFAAGAVLLGFTLGSSGSDVGAVIGILLIAPGVIGGFTILIEMSSYLRSINTKKVYFQKMRHKIIESDTYDSFCRNFYLERR
jgi:hypothetical protein